MGSRVWNFLRVSFLAGVGVLLPLILLVILFQKVLSMLRNVSDPIAKAIFPELVYLRVYATEIVTLGLLALAAVGIGFIASTVLGQKLGFWVESRTLMRFGPYRSFKEFSTRLIPSSNKNLFQPALLVRKDEMQTLIFVVEEMISGHYVFFVPSTPSTFSGALYVVPKTDVEILDVPAMDLVKIFSHWGVGTGKILEQSRYFYPRVENIRDRSLNF
jgi:uncharacterized membrane protein